MTQLDDSDIRFVFDEFFKIKCLLAPDEFIKLTVLNLPKHFKSRELIMTALGLNNEYVYQLSWSDKRDSKTANITFSSKEIAKSIS